MAMATNLIELVKGYLTPDVVDRAAAFVGDSPVATQKALSGIVPTIVAGLADMSSTSEGAQRLTRALDAPSGDGGALSDLRGLFAGDATTKDAQATGQGVLESV